jgi:hypothetical protein
MQPITTTARLFDAMNKNQPTTNYDQYMQCPHGLFLAMDVGQMLAYQQYRRMVKRRMADVTNAFGWCN